MVDDRLPLLLDDMVSCRGLLGANDIRLMGGSFGWICRPGGSGGGDGFIKCGTS